MDDRSRILSVSATPDSAFLLPGGLNLSIMWKLALQIWKCWVINFLVLLISRYLKLVVRRPVLKKAFDQIVLKQAK